MKFETPKVVEPLKNLIASLRKQFSEIQESEIWEFKNNNPIPHKLILKKDQTDKLTLKVSFNNPEPQNIKAFEIKITRATYEDQEFEEIRSIKVDSPQVEIPSEKQLGKIKKIKITEVIRED